MVVCPESRYVFLEAVRGMLEPTRVEPGCMSFSLYQDVENENTFVLMEEWETKADLDNHIRGNSYRNLLVVMDLLREPPGIEFNTVSHRAGMEYVKRVLDLHH